MKRKIEVTAPGIRIVATLDSRHTRLMRWEVDRIRDQLADRLQDAAAYLDKDFQTPRNRVRVR